MFKKIHNHVYTTDLIISSDDVENLKQKIRDDASHSIRVSNVNYRTTTSETYSPQLWNDNSYDDLFNKINNIIDPDSKLEIHSPWVMRYTGNQKTSEHDHKSFDIVAIYYLSAPEGSGVLEFPEFDIDISPYTGLLVKHAGHIRHKVRQNTKEDIERFCAVISYRYKKDNSDGSKPV